MGSDRVRVNGPSDFPGLKPGEGFRAPPKRTWGRAIGAMCREDGDRPGTQPSSLFGAASATRVDFSTWKCPRPDRVADVVSMRIGLSWSRLVGPFGPRRGHLARERPTPMADRSNHYEAAFEGYIRSIWVPCVAVDEAKRAFFGDGGVKNPDFLLYPRYGPNLVVEVKGKRGKNAKGRRPWENWVTTDDLDGLARWQEMFGPGFRAILAFAYAEPLQPFPLPRENGAYEFRGLDYRF